MIKLYTLSKLKLYPDRVNMKITIETVNNINGEKNIVIFQGSSSPDLLRLIKNAKAISAWKAEKAAISEGKYYIEFNNGKEEKKYSVKNNYWIYDMYEEKFFRCSILSNLRGYLLDYLFKEGYVL